MCPTLVCWAMEIARSFCCWASCNFASKSLTLCCKDSRLADLDCSSTLYGPSPTLSGICVPRPPPPFAPVQNPVGLSLLLAFVREFVVVPPSPHFCVVGTRNSEPFPE